MLQRMILRNNTDALKGKSAVFEIQRTVGGQTSTLKTDLTPRENPPEGEGPIGVTYTTMDLFSSRLAETFLWSLLRI